MHLKASLNDLPIDKLKMLNRMINHSKLLVEKVFYDQKKGIISIPIERHEMPPSDSILVNIMAFFKSSKIEAARIKSKIIIKKVDRCRIVKHLEKNSKIEILFGLLIKENSIYICSAEEAKGVTCYELEAAVKAIDIEVSP